MTRVPGSKVIIEFTKDCYAHTMGEQIMATLEELKTAVGEQTTAINDMQLRVQEDIQALQAQISSAGADNPEITQLLENIRSNTTSITTLDPVVNDVTVEDGGAPVEDGPVPPAPLPDDSGTDQPAVDEPATPVDEPTVDESGTAVEDGGAPVDGTVTPADGTDGGTTDGAVTPDDTANQGTTTDGGTTDQTQG